MRIASLAEVQAKLSAYVQIVETKGPVVITRNGKAVAILLAPVDDDDLERLLLARSPRFQSLLRHVAGEHSRGHGRDAHGILEGESLVPPSTWEDARRRQAPHPGAGEADVLTEPATA
jgi:prevent-host-death family protein